jgi:hypothetical protein
VKAVVLAALRFYKRRISPKLPPSCRFTPTCSEYMMEAVEVHGAVRGVWMGSKRILRCNPFTKPGYDPVPPKKERPAT